MSTATGPDLPVGVAQLTQVSLNCAACHLGTVRDAPTSPPRLVPGMPSHREGGVGLSTSTRRYPALADCSINTVTKLLMDMGATCSEYQNKTLRSLPCKRVQVDEIWAFVYAKDRNVLGAKQAPDGAGDIWTWTAICADTKLVPSWLVGDRSGQTAKRFICDLSVRLANRIQLTSDGHKVYLQAVEEGFGAARASV